MSALTRESPRPPGARMPRLDSLKNPQPRPRPRIQKQIPNRCINPDCDNSEKLSIEDGKLVCQSCGTVADDSPDLVTDLQYGLDNGRHVVHGHHVAAESGYVRSADVYDRNRQISSLEHTNLAGKRYAIQICSALQISPALQEAGMQVFRLASSINFIQGRRTKSVAAVALYIACRSQRENPNQYMLIDFSDVLQLNVFQLGKIYADLVAELRVNPNGMLINPINPEDLILRFAQRLEFASETMRVANDAVRIVQRMNRDWMTPGRRPAGICGAALLIAAKMNNFRRTPREMVYVVKVNEATLSKRLEEFKGLESSNLTVEEFRTIELERNADPPAFTQGSKKRRTHLQSVTEFDDDGDQWGDQPTPASALRQAEDRQRSSQTTSTIQQSATGDQISMPPPSRPTRMTSSENVVSLETPAEANMTGDDSLKRKRGRPRGSEASQPADELSLMNALTNPFTVQGSELRDAIDSVEIPGTDELGAEEGIRSTTITVPLTTEIDESEFATDPEVNNCLLDDQEVAIKTRIWTSLNADWLRAQASKKLKQETAEANGTKKSRKMRPRRRHRMGDLRGYAEDMGADGQARIDQGEGVGASAAEAVERMMKRRAFSDKINYQILRDVYTPSAEGSSRRSSVARNTEEPEELDSNASDTNEAPDASTAMAPEAEPRAHLGSRINLDPRAAEEQARQQQEMIGVLQELEHEGIDRIQDIEMNIRDEGEQHEDDIESADEAEEEEIEGYESE